MSSNNEINFGPVFMRGRKPVQVTPKLGTGSPSGVNAGVLSKSSSANLQTNPTSMASNHSLNPPSLAPPTLSSLPKSFSAAVSPGKDAEQPSQPKYSHSSSLNPAEPIHHHHLSSPQACQLSNGIPTQPSSSFEYSREALLNLYSQDLAQKLPPDLELTNPAVSEEFVGPPLTLSEMSESEKELFSSPFNSDRRSVINKAQHHLNNDHHPPNSPLSPDGASPIYPTNKLPPGGTVKLGKASPNDRFTNLGIQGGVLAGVTSQSHSNPRRRIDHDNESSELIHRRSLRTSEDPSSPNLPHWINNSRDRQTRDLSGHPTDAKWKRGVTLEEKTNPISDNSTGSHLKYSVLDKMREKAAHANLKTDSKENVQPSSHDSKSIDHESINQSLPTNSSQPSPISPSNQSNLENQISTAQLPPNGDNNQSLQPSNLINNQSVETSVDTQPSSINVQDPSNGLTNGNFDQSTVLNQPSPSDLPPEDIAWQYRDPSGTVQGPFTAFQMQEWYKASFFRDDLLVKRVMDVAFETLETLILRVGNRDKPFLARPPPALPPNLPLPLPPFHNRPLPHPLHSIIQTQVPNIFDQASTSFSPSNENLSVIDSSLPSHPNSIPNQLPPIPDPDLWNSIGPNVSPMIRQGTALPMSSPLVTSTGWDSGIPSFVQPNSLSNNDFNPNILGNGLPQSFSQSETIRFLQQIHHPALSMVAPNGYPYPLPLPHQPGFGQIPGLLHLVNGSGIDPIIAAQLHSQLSLHSPSYRINPSINPPETVESHPDQRDHTDKSTTAPSNPLQTDPWQVPSDSAPRVPPIPLIPEHTLVQHSNPSSQLASLEPTPLVKQDTWINSNTGPVEPIGSRSSGKNTPTLTCKELNSSQSKSSDPQLQSGVGPTPLKKSDHSIVPTDLSHTEPSPSQTVHFSLNEQKPSNFKNNLTSSKSSTQASITTQSSAPSVHENSSKPVSVSPKFTTTTEITPTHDTPTTLADSTSQTLKHRPPAKGAHPARDPVPYNLITSKQSTKVVLLSKAQQEEHDRRTASIQKTQLQLKEAQAVERAAREASEAAAAAAVASINTPAPWSKEEKVSTPLSLTEIQAMEAKQAEKRRLAEKQAAVERALAEQAAAAERASKTVKEILPPTSTWAATSSAPVKVNSIIAPVWGSNDSESPVMNVVPKQSMKQIQEEEARKKKLALQQQAKLTSGNGVGKPAGGYANSVVAAASKQPVSASPWSVVGAKSKVVAPPTAKSSLTNVVVPGLPTITRPGASSLPVNKSVLSSPQVVNNNNKSPNKTSQATLPPSSNSGNVPSNINPDGPPPASPEFMKWLREALRGMNNVDDFVKMLLDFPINPDESVLEIVSDSVYAGSATLDGRRFAKEFNMRRHADVMTRMNQNNKPGQTKAGNRNNANITTNPGNLGVGSSNNTVTKSIGTMAEAVKSHPAVKNDGWGFAVVKKKKK
ncbi:hypothetical protein O181_023528 [Austropuccinia psidii MF-1]|uniref:GYF domain-containing protein n=1 Tax=Austropuccinia psidii MF-1 TaxID=1389203 RepID=A0A9Q3CH87_9BASI|nr:hypothetical protein [Austropuccinia psidii MF-1]